jgi:RimJ/RimL family protein N-acetyltransferase
MNKDNTSQIFCIMINETKTVIWNVWLNKIDHINKCWFFWIVIFEDNNCWKWYGKESIELVHIFAKQHLNLRKICLHVYWDNKNAIKLYSKIWYKEVWRWKNHKLYNWNFIDDVMMEIFL